MMKPILITLGSVALLSACATTSVSESSEPATVVATAEGAPEGTQMVETKVIKPETISSTVEDGDGIICKYRDVAGSNFRRKMCGTAEEWAAIEEEARQATGRIQRRNRGFEPSN